VLVRVNYFVLIRDMNDKILKKKNMELKFKYLILVRVGTMLVKFQLIPSNILSGHGAQIPMNKISYND